MKEINLSLHPATVEHASEMYHAMATTLPDGKVRVRVECDDPKLRMLLQATLSTNPFDPRLHMVDPDRFMQALKAHELTHGIKGIMSELDSSTAPISVYKG